MVTSLICKKIGSIGAWIGGGVSSCIYKAHKNYLLMKALATCWQLGVFLICLFVCADNESMIKNDEETLTAHGYEDRAW